MRLSTLFLATGFLVCSAAHAQVTTQALPEPTIQTEPLDVSLSAGIESRRQALLRLAPELKVERVKTTPAKCVADVKSAFATGAYQVFVERQGQVPALVPLEFNVVLRETVDVTRLTPVCQVATSLVVTRFSDTVKRSKDPRVQRDYVIALMMADWIQSKADGTSLLGREFPPFVLADTFGVLNQGK